MRIQELHKGSEAAAHPDRCNERKMDYAKTKLAVAIAVLACAVAIAVPAAAQQQIVLPPPILVTAQSVTISNSPGDQTDPHASKDLASYTDNVAGQIHYYRFSSRVDAAIPSDPTLVDILSDGSGDLVAFSRITPDRNAVMVFDTLGDSRVVWAANDGRDGDQDIHRLTFTPISHQVSYQICLLYDSSVAKKSGSAYPITLQLCDANGHNVSSASIVLQALGVTQANNNSRVAFDDTGNANPDFDFRYGATFEGYIFNLSTKGYGTGIYSLSFTAGADRTVHTASFAVK